MSSPMDSGINHKRKKLAALKNKKKDEKEEVTLGIVEADLGASP